MKFDLNQIRIATPCHAKWNQMKGDDRVRHCGDCKLNVYNVAGLTNKEVQELLVKSAKGERVCMRLTRRKDGTILTSDCPVGVRIARRVRLKIAAIGVPIMSAIFWLAGGVYSRAEERLMPMGSIAPATSEQPVLMGKPAVQEPEVLMGDIAEPEIETEKDKPAPKDRPK